MRTRLVSTNSFSERSYTLTFKKVLCIEQIMNKTIEKTIISANDVKETLQLLEDDEKAKVLQRFFKTAKGEYGEGDVFLGIVVPEQRKVAKKYATLPLSDVNILLQSKIHEHRLVALLILVEQFKKSDEKGREQERKIIFDFYMNNAQRINNWDLVDLTAPNIAGEYLLDKKKDTLYAFAKSKNLWERRIAIVATYAFIRKGKFDDTLKITETLLTDKHDLIHKACGWMLREVGKRDEKTLHTFLKKHAKNMPRTMLRYAIERMSEDKRQEYLRR
jgi:3-methyladenine DNA glycosylase AlkD